MRIYDVEEEKRKSKLVRVLTYDNKFAEGGLFCLISLAGIIVAILGLCQVVNMEGFAPLFLSIFLIFAGFSVFYLVRLLNRKKHYESSLLKKVISEHKIISDLTKVGFDTTKTDYVIRFNNFNSEKELFIAYAYDYNVYLELRMSHKSYVISAEQNANMLESFDVKAYKELADEKSFIDYEEEREITSEMTFEDVLNDFKNKVETFQSQALDFSTKFYKHS